MCVVVFFFFFFFFFAIVVLIFPNLRALSNMLRNT